METLIGRTALDSLVQRARREDWHAFLLLADDNTWAALGARVRDLLAAQGADVRAVVLHGAPLVADEDAVMQTLLGADNRRRVWLAVGSGTLTDITRFVSHRLDVPFVSIPTAPSVDGFTSSGAALTVRSIKHTVPCHSPTGVYADLDTLMAAPPRLIAAGFGDLAAKLLSTADWELGAVLWDERYDAALAERTRGLAWRSVERAAAIGARDESAIQALMEGLIESGKVMLEFGTSAPASGGEHHLSHFWERDAHRADAFHGLKVGVASVLTAEWYRCVRVLTRQEAAERLAQVKIDPERAKRAISNVYGPAAAQIIKEQAAFIELDSARWGAVRERIVEQWDVVQAIADRVPDPEQLANWLRAAGAAATPAELGLDEASVQRALAYAHYLRPRLTINKLRLWLGLTRGER